MAVANINIPPFPKFDLDDYTNVATKWEKYKKRFLNLCTALQITDDKQKLALLLNYMGEESYDVYDSLLVPGADETFANAIELFDKHFKPKSNVNYEVYHLFRKITQSQDEKLHQFWVNSRIGWLYDKKLFETF